VHRAAEVYAEVAGDVATSLPACEVASKAATIELVAVIPKDAPPFALALEKVPVLAHPSPVPDAPVAVQAFGVIEFRGLAAIDGYALKRPRVLAGGLVRAGRGARLVRAGARGALLSGTLALASGSLLVDGVAMPCAALEVPSEPDATPAEEDADASIEGDELVDFWSSPGRGRKIAVWPGASFHRVETRGDFTHLATTLSDGSALHGWVRSDRVSEGFFLGGLGYGRGLCGGVILGSGETVGPATVHAGTKVSAIPGGAPWGEVASAARVVVHAVGRGPKWELAWIEEAPGYRSDPDCSRLSNTYIPGDSFDFVAD
jgi:hypothetical protein